MRHEIGMWMDSYLQKQIKCIVEEDKNFESLLKIYETIYSLPENALNDIRKNTEKLFEDFFTEKRFTEKTFSNALASCNKLHGEKDKKYKDIKKYFDNKDEKGFTNIILDEIYSYGSLIRIYGNSGSHYNDEFSKEEYRQMAVISLIAFVKLFKIFNKEKKTNIEQNNKKLDCKNFQDFIYDKLQVIYQTKDDVEEWNRIRFNKLQFNYNLYSLNGKIKKGKLQLDKIIENEQTIQENSYSKNIYFINLDDNKGYKKFKKFYKELSNDVDEEDFFKISQKLDEIETIDMIPLRIIPIDTNHPYKWDMCYLNLSIELENFGIDLILFLVFSSEKIDELKNRYSLEFIDLNENDLRSNGADERTRTPKS